jgi:hypothetical protein
MSGASPNRAGYGRHNPQAVLVTPAILIMKGRDMGQIVRVRRLVTRYDEHTLEILDPHYDAASIAAGLTNGSLKLNRFPDADFVTDANHRKLARQDNPARKSPETLGAWEPA